MPRQSVLWERCMKKAMILLAGYPATGKTFLCSRILKRHSEFIVVSQDEMKEKLWDRFGFENIEEKTRLEDQSWELYYETLEELMSGEHSVISDYPFSEKQKGRLESLSLTYGYQVLRFALPETLMFCMSVQKAETWNRPDTWHIW